MFLEIILSLITIILFAVFALRPTVLTITELLRVIETKQEVIGKMDQKIQDLNNAQQLYVQEASRIALLSTAIPNDPGPDLLMRQMEGVAARNSLALQNITVGETTLVGQEDKGSSDKTIAGGAKAVSFSVSGSNSFLTLIQFLKDLESMRRPAKIDGVSLSAPIEGNLSGNTEPSILLTGQVPFVGQ